jgi:hypothetical protein
MAFGPTWPAPTLPGAYQAVWALAAAPKESVSFMEEQVQPVPLLPRPPRPRLMTPPRTGRPAPVEVPRKAEQPSWTAANGRGRIRRGGSPTLARGRRSQTVANQAARAPAQSGVT